MIMIYWALNSSLLAAAEAGDAKHIQKMLDQGADVNYRDISKETPLMWAARRGHTACVEELLGSGAQVDAANSSAETALSLAAENGHTECARALISAGADVNQHDKTGKTPLMKAIGFQSTLECLIAAGADIHATTGLGGWTAIQYAGAHKKEESCRYLAECGADIQELYAISPKMGNHVRAYLETRRLTSAARTPTTEKNELGL